MADLVAPPDNAVEASPGLWELPADIELIEDPAGSGLWWDKFWALFRPPAIHPLVEQAYANLGPWSRADVNLQLLEFLKVLLGSLLEVDDIVRDTDTHVGWGTLLDIESAPNWALPWLAQFVGVSTITGLSNAEQRDRIKKVAGFNRGTPAAIVAAARQYLTGTKTVELYEREGSAWVFRLRTYQTETPDAQKVYDAVYALKPAGVVFIYEVQSGLDVDTVTGDIDSAPGTIDSYSQTNPI